MALTPLNLVKLSSLQNATSGSKRIPVGLIDGPVDIGHPSFQGASIQTVSSRSGAACQSQKSPACIHGTFVAGLLAGGGGTRASGICPQSPLLVRPIFCEASDLSQCPTVTPKDLAGAVQETVDAGAKIINL